MINQLKTVLLLGILTAVLLVIGSFWGKSGLTIAFVFVLLMNFVSYWFSDKIVLAIYKAKKLTRNQAPQLHKIIEDVAKEAKIPKPEVYIVPSENPNAFATGRSKKHAVVAVTQGILDLLTEEELKGVIAHEIGHIKNYDMLISTIAAVIAGVITYVSMMARWAAIFGGMRDDSRGSGNALELLILAILAPIIALIIRLAISRSREYLADETGARLIHNGKPLASALSKLHTASRIRPMRIGNQATSHMFIVNPFSGKSLINMFSTHPDVESRIKKLRALSF